MSCLQRLDALEAIIRQTQWSHQKLQSQGLTAQQHSERAPCHLKHGVCRSARHIRYSRLLKAALQ